MKISLTAALVAAAIVLPSLAGAPPACCPECGGKVRKVCRLVPEIKKEFVVKYCPECEDLCLPGPSRCHGGLCPFCCLHCGCGKQCGVTWEPTCGPIITRTKLRREVVTEEKPVYRCVVETVCCQCGATVATTQPAREK